MIKVSVIVPVYNVEQYLTKCLESLINQTLKEIEIICIEDCSTDSSRDILEEFCRKDDRIHIIYNQKNLGLSCSRNRGIEEARGEYIQFVDSDDWLQEDALEEYYNISHHFNLDVLRTNITYEYQNGTIKRNSISYPELYEKKILEGLHDVADFMTCVELNYWCYAVISFVKRDYIKQKKIRFYDGIYYEDVLFTFDLMISEPKLRCVNSYKYMYLKREDSILGMKQNSKHVYGYLTCFFEIMKRLAGQNNIEVTYAIYNFLKVMQKMLCVLVKKIGIENIKTDVWEKEKEDLYYKLINEQKETIYIDEVKMLKNRNMLEKLENVYIYGAGEVAYDLLIFLEKRKWSVTIEGMVVTQKNEKKQMFGYQILEIDELNFNEEEPFFLLAVSNKYAATIIENLKKRGFSNYLYVC